MGDPAQAQGPQEQRCQHFVFWLFSFVSLLMLERQAICSGHDDGPQRRSRPNPQNLCTGYLAEENKVSDGIKAAC